MAKVRVYKLAKELNVQSALILELLDRMGREVKSDLSTLDESTADEVRRRLTAAIDAERKRLEEIQLRERQAEEERARLEAEAAPQVAEQQAEPEAAESAPAEAPVEEAPATAPTAAGPAEEPSEAPEPERPAVEEPELPAVAAAAEDAEPKEKVEKEPEPAAPSRPATAPAAAAASTSSSTTGTPGKRAPRVFAAKVIPTKSMLQKTLARARAGAARAGATARPGARPAVPPRGARPGARPAPAPGAPGKPQLPKRRRKKGPTEKQIEPAQPKRKVDLPPVPENITLSEGVTVKELAEKLNRKSKDVIAKLISRGMLATINQPLEPEVAVEVAKEFGSSANVISFEEQALLEASAAHKTEELPIEAEAAETGERLKRPPVVTVMGHVDHGKTSLLDAIREANVVSSEHGGITQHIGAYQVEAGDQKITFLDTPGHEAFTLMRARGARVTDVVVLVVAADDGVKPQTLEAIDHAKAAGVPIVVAINKIDKPNAQSMRVKQQLADHELLVEEYGGDVVACEVSAKKGTGISELLDMILLVSDMQELKASPEQAASGVILEAKLDRSRGVLATVLVQDGTLRQGDPFIAGNAFGKVRAMVDENNNRVESAGPATPVEVMGLTGEPTAGDLFQTVADETKARQIAAFRQEKERQKQLASSSRRTLESLAQEIAEGEIKELPVLLKADVQGSIEALRKSLEELPSDKVRVSILRAGTGAVTQADVLLASASNAIVVGFNVRPDRATADLAKQEKVEIRSYSVIYDLVNEIKQAMVGLLEPTLKETVLGQAEVRQLFKVPKIGIIGGCYVIDGRVTRNAEVRLLRDHVVIYTGKVGSLKRFKDDVAEVKQGYECGIGIANYNDIKEGDVIEFFVMEKVAAESL